MWTNQPQRIKEHCESAVHNRPTLAEEPAQKDTQQNLQIPLKKNTGYVYMHNFWFSRTEFIPIDESECSVYMNAK